MSVGDLHNQLEHVKTLYGEINGHADTGVTQGDAVLGTLAHVLLGLRYAQTGRPIDAVDSVRPSIDQIKTTSTEASRLLQTASEGTTHTALTEAEQLASVFPEQWDRQTRALVGELGTKALELFAGMHQLIGTAEEMQSIVRELQERYQAAQQGTSLITNRIKTYQQDKM